MSTNFYWKPPSGNPLSVFKEIHIGLRANGLTFMFQGYNVNIPASEKLVEVAAGLELAVALPAVTFKVASWAEWQELLQDGEIYSEYHAPYSLEEFREVVNSTSSWNGKPAGNWLTQMRASPQFSRDTSLFNPDQYWFDPEGYSFSTTQFS